MRKSLLLALLCGCSLHAAVVATFNGGEVTDEEVNALLHNVLQQQQHNLTASDIDKLKERIVDSIISTKLVLQHAKSGDFTRTDDYKKAVENAQNAVTLQYWERGEYEKIQVADSEIRKIYDENKDKMLIPAQVKAKHILVASESEAKSLIRQIKAKSGAAARVAEFERLAKSKSIDKGSGAQGGELGWFEQSKMVPEFANAAFEMSKGTISNSPVKSQFGYHIIYKEDARAQQPVAYEQVKPQIENQIRSQKMAQVIEAKVDELKKRANIRKNLK